MSSTIEIVLPDIGDYTDVPIVEVFVKPGDVVAVDMPLLAIESDKATMEVPSLFAGTVRDVKVQTGTRVSQGMLLMVLTADTVSRPAALGMPLHLSRSELERDSLRAPTASGPSSQPPMNVSAITPNEAAFAVPDPPVSAPSVQAHASPSVRTMARELGVDLPTVTPTGPNARILRADVIAHVRGMRHTPPSSIAASTAIAARQAMPAIDFAKFGPVERRPLSRVQKLSGGNLSRNWQTIPHVTNFDKADVTGLEAFRQKINTERRLTDAKLTMVAFLIKASALALKAFPNFNASLDGDDLVLKHYVDIGFATDTPQGLMVPVIRECDGKGLVEIAAELRALANKANEGRLPARNMQGGCFTVSSLGGVGGSGFTPIINAPEVAILGAGRSSMEASWDGKAFQPRLVLPLSLSWDHRVIDGVAAAKFLGHIAATLADFRRAIL